MELTIDKERVA